MNTSRCSIGACYLPSALPGPSRGDNPQYETFLRQHLDEPRSTFQGKYCDAIMSQRGLTKHECKEVNSFIHAPRNKIKAVCDEGGQPYGKLQISNQPFKVTTCKLKGDSKHPPCQYREETSSRNIVIACKDGWPVHYDEGKIVPRRF